MPPKLKSFEFYKNVLNGAKYVVAPMVDQSELAWRMLCRKYDAQLCYTPMLHSKPFISHEKYRKEVLQTCPEDRPLIVQFCGNDPVVFQKAVELTIATIECDAVDLNLGCPQTSAKSGQFGAFLADNWNLVHKMVSSIHDNFELPITCKIRIYDSLEKSIDYAKMLESAGCQLLTVHGRTRKQKQAYTGIASWEYIEAIRGAVNIPVIANGNIQCFEDVERCLQQTGVQGVMSAEGNLYNPAIFCKKLKDNPPSVWDVALEYLDLVNIYPCPFSYSYRHVSNLLHHVLQITDNLEIKRSIKKAQTLAQLRQAVLQIKSKYITYFNNESTWIEPLELATFNLKYPSWICQPYVRPSIEEHVKLVKERKERESQRKRCPICNTPVRLKCDNELCRACCIEFQCFVEGVDCSVHQIHVKSEAVQEYIEEESEPKYKMATD